MLLKHSASDKYEFWGFIILSQAPLTTSDTAILSGSLSTHNGNGGGNINLALRRVTSAKGWGEVRTVCFSYTFAGMTIES